MAAYLRTDRGDLLLTLSADSEVVDVQMAATPQEAARVAVMMIAARDSFNAGDTLTCRNANGQSETVLRGPGGAA